MRLLPFRRAHRPVQPATRRGFSFIELMVVFVVFGLVAAIGVPRFDYMRSTTKMRSAKTEITAVLATARATAIRRGRAATVVRTGNELKVVSGGETVVQPVRLDSLFGATIASTAPTIVSYDSRGLASLATSPGVFAFSREELRDSVCITRYGAVMKDGCL